MTMKITKDSHVDHAIPKPILQHACLQFDEEVPFFMETIVLPEHLGKVPCGLYGPKMEDEVPEDVWMVTRPGREGKTPLIKNPHRPTNLLTVLGGMHEGQFILFTAYGGPIMPREPWDKDIADDAELGESCREWKKHCLAVPEGMALVRIYPQNRNEVFTRLVDNEITFERINRWSEDRDGQPMLSLAVHCSGNRFHKLIQDIAKTDWD